ncbi:proline dehydrogenase family protein [Brevibacillus sp. M2.1A]|uniref:proline dehydrogenase family protein n=1 Tax=Brevibacillus TaxID=55080 RepID=UPI00156B89FA|nr:MULTISPECIES: proline dehydrogenase family protein [Brevibacillus]MBY0085964.1 proline dehydrogenase family protein [Brevibacillus brevis]MCC8438339.1 proline dehydrogenase family protein [Brevibacillus sp. M2.1A]MCE0451619.1 proline dehydrogenase family protein [Brevibacillus sp. AF8]UKL00413.1 proline dehydrogenase [Brevibacillus brevis]
MTPEERRTADILRTIARDERIKEAVRTSPLLYPLLLTAAKRYVTGETRADAIKIAQRLEKLGYRLSMEHIGENTLDSQIVHEAQREFLALTTDCSQLHTPVGISFDLSHLGLLLDKELAFAHVEELAERARHSGHYLMISMEESTKTEAIISMYERLAQRHENVGITIQAHLHRSLDDVKRVLGLPGKIRLVKGAFKEPQEIALGRSVELNERYLELADMCVRAGRECSLATHDQAIVDALDGRDYLHRPNVEVELLYGVRPDLAHVLREKGVTVRLYLTYGTEWYLYLCHRLAEHPPHVHQAIADMFDTSRLQDVGYGMS